VAVLTYRFWNTTLSRDASVIGRKIRLGSRSATIVGVLEPSVPYPADTEIISNIVTSPHHLGATMVTQRTHRMTELFGRLAPGATLEAARAELTAVHATMLREHPEAFSPNANPQLTVRPLRDQITAPARTILLLLLAAAGVVFIIACSNVANLILARTPPARRRTGSARRARRGHARAPANAARREPRALRGRGVLGVLLARPLVSIVAGYAARFSVRALDVTVDPSLLWVGAGLAMLAAVVLAYVPRLPSAHAPTGLTSGGLRITAGTNRRLRMFAMTQIALSFVLLAGAGMILSALIALQTAHTGYDMRQVLAIDVPLPIEAGSKSVAFFEEAVRRIETLAGVERVAAATSCRGATRAAFSAGRCHSPSTATHRRTAKTNPRARLRNVTPGFFAALGVPMVAGRDFNDQDKAASELVVVVSQSVAQRLFSDGDALNRHMWWTDANFGKKAPRRIVGIVARCRRRERGPWPGAHDLSPAAATAVCGPAVRAHGGDPTRWSLR
jgi:hypothetical protein